MSKADVPSDPKARWAWIKYKLELKGHTLASLATHTGVTRSGLSQVMYRPYPRMEKAISATIGLPPHHVWPERYSEDGKTKVRIGRPRRVTQKQVRNLTYNSEGTTDKVQSAKGAPHEG